MDYLYYGDTECHCGGRHDGGFHNEGVIVGMDVLGSFMRKIHGGFDARNEVEQGMWREVLRIINEGTVEGLMQAPTPPTHEEEFYRALRHSNEVFAAFKVHDMGELMAQRLLDANGKLKPFRQWAEEVQSISSHHVGSWLRTEYDTAVLRAHAAADWREFERNKDVMPNLRWVKTTSPNPEGSHRQYWEKGLVLPVDDPFWDEHHPGDRWNCKCSLEQTDDPVTMPDDMEPTPPQRGLENNPGKDGHTFNDTHPYFPDSCSHCFAYRNSGLKNRLKVLFRNQKKGDCNDCQYINRCIDNSEIQKYDKKRWEHTYVSEKGNGYVVTEKERIREATVSKNEKAKFQKEMNMCKVAADNGHAIEFLQGTNRPKGYTYDIYFDGMPTDLKATSSHNNVEKYVKKAALSQGAECVLFEFSNKNSKIYKALRDAHRKYPQMKIHFYFVGENLIKTIK